MVELLFNLRDKYAAKDPDRVVTLLGNHEQLTLQGDLGHVLRSGGITWVFSSNEERGKCCKNGDWPNHYEMFVE
ncbi:MAG: hypothetical protein HQK51_01955, partial [Oligoflexia bacterium]|nr:hypothetical protein [Oligoflexia bacterium]